MKSIACCWVAIPFCRNLELKDWDPHLRHAKNGDLSTTTDTIPPSAYRKLCWPTTKVTRLDTWPHNRYLSIQGNVA